MSKVTLNTITSGYGSVAALNDNFDIIEAAFDNTVSRDGDLPNEMEADIDMNGFRLTNLGAPSQPNDAIRLADVAEGVVIVDGDVLAFRAELGSTALGLGASLVGVHDAAANFAGTTVEDVLAELQTAIDAGPNLTGHITSSGNATVLGSFSIAQLNSAINDADVVTLTGTETLTNKTLTSPISNTPTISTPTINGAIAGDAVALQAEMETATATDSIVTPGRQHYHPGMAKAWLEANSSGGVITSYNVTSVTDGGTGRLTATWNVDFSSANYSTVIVGQTAGNADFGILDTTTAAIAAGSCGYGYIRPTAGYSDPITWHIVAYGDH